MRQPHKMVKHIQTICREQLTILFERVWPFCRLALKRLKFPIESNYTFFLPPFNVPFLYPPPPFFLAKTPVNL